MGGDPITTHPSPGMNLQVEVKQRPLKPNSPVAIVDEIYPIASMGLVYLPTFTRIIKHSCREMYNRPMDPKSSYPKKTKKSQQNDLQGVLDPYGHYC